MSFLDDVKSQIISSVYKNVCCRRALLNGVVFAKGEASGKDVSISLENTECIDFVSGLIKEFFGKEPLVFAPPRGGRRKIVSFSSPALSKYLDSVPPGGELYQRKCQGCDQAFLRGVFIASGRASDPSKQYRIEFAKSSDTVRLREHLLSLGLDFSFATRRGESILYTSNSVTCEDFFAEIGLNSTAFKLMNAKIENQFKNEEAYAVYQKLRDNADYSTATFYRGVRMTVDPMASSGSMLSLVTSGTASQINVYLKSVENEIEGAVKEANKLIQDIISQNE
jgi:DNA-binding transcriptional regulator WhiA